jgi:hypothetical protein
MTIVAIFRGELLAQYGRIRDRNNHSALGVFQQLIPHFPTCQPSHVSKNCHM